MRSILSTYPCGSQIFAVAFLFLALGTSVSFAQLQTLSQGNASQQWRDAQLQIFEKQLADKATPEELRLELTAQRNWLARWQPARSRSKQNDDSQSASTAAKETSGGQSKKQTVTKEPILDPNETASQIRAALFNPKKRPSVEDTTALQTALSEHSADVGLRQLQMHWIDQSNYREEYWQETIDACDRVIGLLEKEKESAETKLAAAFAYYRKARVLAYCLNDLKSDSPKIARADKINEEQLASMKDALDDCGRKVIQLVGSGEPAFCQLEIYTLRRDGWSGRALEVLEQNADLLDKSAYLAERKSILDALGWTKPAAETADMLAKLPGNRRMLEIQFGNG